MERYHGRIHDGRQFGYTLGTQDGTGIGNHVWHPTRMLRRRGSVGTEVYGRDKQASGTNHVSATL